MKDHAVIILRNDNKVLFVQRSETKKILPNIWAFPSGTVEKGEQIKETVIREAKEELGVSVNIERTLTAIELPEFKVKLHFVVCTTQSGKPTIQELDEIQSIQWLTFKEFFDKYNDIQIGHGLIYLRRHQEILEPHFNLAM